MTQTELPFFPSCIRDDHNGLAVWWFEKDFSQITYGPCAQRGKNACVLITLLTASKIAQKSCRMAPKCADGKPCHSLVVALAEGILEGIDTYANLMNENRLEAANLNIPEAYQALGRKVVRIHEWKSFLYVVPMKDNLANFLLEGLHAWSHKSLAKKHFLFVVVIADNRAILIVFDQISGTATFIDSHPHSTTHGACVCQTGIGNLKALCAWISKMYRELYHSSPTCFEVSYFQTRHK